MGSRASRILAMVCSAAALVCVVAWLFAGAPNVPHINLLTDPTSDVYSRNGDESLGWFLIWGLAYAWPLAAHLVLAILALAVASAAGLSLVILTRSERKGAVGDLGVGLGLWSLSVTYLGLFTVVTVFEFFNRLPFSLRMACDVAAFLLLFASGRAVVRFWMGFPRSVDEAELAGFIGGPRAAKPVSGAARALGIGFSLVCMVWMGLLWRGVWDVPFFSGIFDTLVSLLLIGMALGSIGALGWPVLKCLRLLRFHRAVGSPEERARIEWIWTALWIAVILCLLPAVVGPVMALGENWFPELAFDWGWIGIYLILAFLTAPLIVIVALALSVFYRGAVDPRLALKGFTVWTLLGVALTLVFVFIERMVATRVVLLMHLPPQTGYVTAGALVAATFQPIRKRMETWVNRFVERVLPETLLASGKHGMAAVAVADLAGFTALTAKDGQGAIVASALMQKEARRVAEAHHGRLVKSMGDGVILCFAQAGECLAAVQELHRVVSARAGALDLPTLELHSGLHWGDVVEMHDGDIYGMTVNLAARIADWAKASEIGASAAFCSQLQDDLHGFESMGPQSFKNVPEPTLCFRRAAT